MNVRFLLTLLAMSAVGGLLFTGALSIPGLDVVPPLTFSSVTVFSPSCPSVVAGTYGPIITGTCGTASSMSPATLQGTTDSNGIVNLAVGSYSYGTLTVPRACGATSTIFAPPLVATITRATAFFGGNTFWLGFLFNQAVSQTCSSAGVPSSAPAAPSPPVPGTFTQFVVQTSFDSNGNPTSQVMINICYQYCPQQVVTTTSNGSASTFTTTVSQTQTSTVTSTVNGTPTTYTTTQTASASTTTIYRQITNTTTVTSTVMSTPVQPYLKTSQLVGLGVWGLTAVVAVAGRRNLEDDSS